MSFTRRRLDALAARFGRYRAYTTEAEIDAVLAEQAEIATAQAADHATLAIAKHPMALCMQPGVLDVHGRLLLDLAYLDGVLTGARHHRLDPRLAELLEAAVAQGNRLSKTLAAIAHGTAEPAPTPSRVQHAGDDLTG
ncbi:MULTISPECIES: hypothetical protein [unclassified Streptomyces]|uniref:hypothetical protein n=1 Tax=unclassified Streptomyces TaxID=2593676 RepID=UPI00081DCF47|nr:MULTISPECIES: hypothetical protein [unclassified Streptomyces]MYR27788.1 hypothetical protein [Streptomyces sp. SID4945]SCF29384.1 hypothetical protein GA0115257_110311 [Streptomyces sp. LcepLS]